MCADRVVGDARPAPSLGTPGARDRRGCGGPVRRESRRRPYRTFSV